MDEKQKLIIKYGVGIILAALGLIFNAFDIGKNYFFGYNSVGNYLVFSGFLIFAVLLLRSFKKKKEAVDERMMFVASKANRLTFLFLMLLAFAVMIADGVSKITIPYSQFMSYFVCAILLFYVISYKILLKYN